MTARSPRMPTGRYKAGGPSSRGWFLAGWVLAGALLSIVASGASAGQTGREFLELCGGGDPWTEGYCTGYITGAGELIDGLLIEEDAKLLFDGKAFCLPDDLNRGDVRDLVLAFLRKRPDVHEKQMTSITWAALIDAFPCN